MARRENEALVRRYFQEAFVCGNTGVIDEIFADDYVNHGYIPGAPVRNRDGMKQVEQAARLALPDIEYRLEHVVASDEMVAHHWTASATHSGGFFGLSATGRRFSVAGMVFSRVGGGKIRQQWRIVDVHGVLEQLAHPGD